MQPQSSYAPARLARSGLPDEELPRERRSRLASAVALDSEQMRQNVLKKFQQRMLALQSLERVPTFKGRLSECPLVSNAAGRCATEPPRATAATAGSCGHAVMRELAESSHWLPFMRGVASAPLHALCHAADDAQQH